jgi:CheY-like chemotaxis protein
VITLKFSIRDTGIGIPAEKQALVFEAFGQADSSTTREFGGTGLGLAISSQLIELMNGRIWVESEYGEGTTFFFTTKFKVSSASKTDPADLSSLRGKRVLIVDDNQTNLTIFEEMLKSWGMKTTTDDSPFSALEVLARAADAAQPFDLVLSDYMMPGLDGFGFVERIRANPKIEPTKVVIASSGIRSGHSEDCNRLKVLRYLTKPVVYSEMLITLLTVFGTKKRQQDAIASLPEASSKLNILLAEDGLVNQKVAVGLLEKRGHCVDVAFDGQEAIEAWKNGSYSLILMDVQMPVLDGYEATAMIRAKEKETGEHIPIVAMTANAMKGDREKCLASGMDGYVAKPVKPAELFEAVERYAQRGV